METTARARVTLTVCPAGTFSNITSAPTNATCQSTDRTVSPTDLVGGGLTLSAGKWAATAGVVALPQVATQGSTAWKAPPTALVHAAGTTWSGFGPSDDAGRGGGRAAAAFGVIDRGPACARGTYSSVPTDTCMVCPASSNTTNVGSVRLDQCLCNLGYFGSGYANNCTSTLHGVPGPAVDASLDAHLVPQRGLALGLRAGPCGRCAG